MDREPMHVLALRELNARELPPPLRLLKIRSGIRHWITRELGWLAPIAPEMPSARAFAIASPPVACRLRSVSAAAVPLGIMLGVHGIREVNVWAWGAALHLTEGVLAVVLLVTFVLAWRRNRSSA